MANSASLACVHHRKHIALKQHRKQAIHINFPENEHKKEAALRKEYTCKREFNQQIQKYNNPGIISL